MSGAMHRQQNLQQIPSDILIALYVIATSHSETLLFTLTHTKLLSRIFHIVHTIAMFNSTTASLVHMAHAPVRLLSSIPRPHFSYVPAAHVKLKANSIAMVLSVSHDSSGCTSRGGGRADDEVDEQGSRRRRINQGAMSGGGKRRPSA